MKREELSMSPRREILAAFGGIPDLPQLAPAEFQERSGLCAPMQYGIVCQDVRLGPDRLETLGAGPFLYAETAPPGWTERGERTSVRAPFQIDQSSKMALEGLSDVMRRELMLFGVHVATIRSGAIDTNVYRGDEGRSDRHEGESFQSPMRSIFRKSARESTR